MLRGNLKNSWFLILIVFASCSLFDGMKKNSFAYDDGQVLPLFVPKGFKKAELKTDKSGNKTRLFSYSDGSALYFYYGDTSQYVLDTSMHISKFYPDNVQFFKGQDSSNRLFWRESRFKNFRFGYRNVSIAREPYFDSSVNYASYQAIRK